MSPNLVDFHCHLDLYPDHETVFNDRERLGIFTLAVTTTPRAWPRNRDLAAGKKYVRAALGLHPQLVSSQTQEYPIWESYLREARFIGEVGLDARPRYYKSLEHQEQVFTQILKACSVQGGKVLSVHSIRTVTSVLNLIEQHLLASRGVVVLHWFTGTLAEAKRAVQLGCYFSINSEMLRKPQHRKTIAELPQDRLLTESDGPFTPTDPGKSHVDGLNQTINLLASVRNTHPEEMAHVVITNTHRLVDDSASALN
jgi:TatD DNase family protein